MNESARKEYREKFIQQMDNDINTPNGVTVIYDILKAQASDATKRAVLADIDGVLSLDLLKKADALREKNAKAAAVRTAEFTVIAEDGTPDEAVETLIRERAEAKKAKNFAEADRIRDELKAQGVELTDIPNGAKWKRV